MLTIYNCNTSPIELKTSVLPLDKGIANFQFAFTGQQYLSLIRNPFLLFPRWVTSWERNSCRFMLVFAYPQNSKKKLNNTISNSYIPCVPPLFPLILNY